MTQVKKSEGTTTIDSLPGNGRFRSTTSLNGDDGDENRQLNIDYQFDTRQGNGTLRAFDVSSSTQQLTHEERTASVNPIRLERYFQYDQVEITRLPCGFNGKHQFSGQAITRKDLIHLPKIQ